MDFVVSVLSAAGDSSQALARLFSDPDSLDLILEDEILVHALLERQGCLTVSRHFYFYVMVRHVLRLSGIDDRGVADYVAAMLAEFSSAQRLRYPIPNDPRPFDYLFEMLAALQTADERTGFIIRAHVGNHSLFVSGVFPDRIQHRAQFRGAPEMEYYERLGSSNFRVAGDSRIAQKYALSPIYDVLSKEFHTVRMALNDMRERLIFLGEKDYSLDALLRKSQEG